MGGLGHGVADIEELSCNLGREFSDVMGYEAQFFAYDLEAVRLSQFGKPEADAFRWEVFAVFPI